MGRLLFLALALAGVGAVLSGSPRTPARPAPAPSTVATATAMPPGAYRPGEPGVVPGAVDLPRAADGHFYADAQVEGQPVRMVVDTGATAVALTVDDARRLGLPIDPAGFRVIGTGASGPVRGAAVMLRDVAVGGRHVGPVEAAVVAGLDRSLLGQSFLRLLDEVRIDGDTMTLR
ncbi:TIGR02281 family clan AA aspartic protease [uncultured Sphingomonas sp.]|uniref:retropepsin-like aspartic protease family protein n=1 Tax=uncultured Sphingomonas sp. TaxID=158754 RepID=UPI0035C9AA59